MNIFTKRIYLSLFIFMVGFSLRGYAATIYVNHAATGGSNNGTSWNNAYISFQSALNIAVSGDKIWVAKGTYKPSSAYDLTNSSRYYHFRMIDDVAIYGGFAGNEPNDYDLTLRDFTANKTILSGDIGTENVSTDNCFHVFYHPSVCGLTSVAVLNGFTITGGYANGLYQIANSGGGMYNDKSSPTLVNITFNSNKANQGGGIANLNNSSPNLTNVLFVSNESISSSGGGIYNYRSSPVLNNVILVSNTASNANGGAIYNYTDCSPVLNNVTIVSNTAKQGGAIFNYNSSPILNNCIVWDNTATTNGNQFYSEYGNITLNFSCYSNNTGDNYVISPWRVVASNNNITSDPKFVDAANNDLRIHGESPCTDHGKNSYNQTSTDIKGQERVQRGTIDMGAYEWTEGVDPGCINPPDGGEISSDLNVCFGGTPKAFTSTPPMGQAGTLEYQWQSSTTNATEGFSNIALASTETYAPEALTITTWFKRLTKAVCMDNWADAVESNVVRITVNENPSVPTITDGSNTYTFDGTLKTAIANISEDETIYWYDAAADGYIVSVPSGINVGAYSAYASAKNKNTGCISSSRTQVTLTIEKLGLSVIPDANQSKIYGETDPTINYSITSALLGDDTFTGALARDAGEDVGSDYDITIGTLSAGDNYTITLADANFSITPKPITVTPDAKSKRYGEVDPYPTFIFAPALIGTDVLLGRLSREEGEDVDHYTVTIGTLDAGSNYEIFLANVDFTITTKPVSVIADVSQYKYYGDADPVLTYAFIPDLIEGDNFSGALSRASGENIGRYAIEIGSLSAGTNYEISFTGFDFEITAKQLAVADPVLTTAKQYDGTTVAAITAGTLSGVIASDEGYVTLTAQAFYDNASVGANKTITVIYTLGGSVSGNYIAPSGYNVNTGVICEKTTIAELQSYKPGCEGGTLEVSYTVLTGEPTEYQLLFGEEAIAAGFANIGYNTVPASSGTGVISIDVPDGNTYGTYTAQLQLRNSIGVESELFPFTFTINLSPNYVVDKFDDVVLCDNSSNQFSTYQWHKNDSPISGATSQFYNDPAGLSGTYYVQVTTTDGKTMQTCPVTYHGFTTKSTINIYPNPGKPGQTFVVEITNAAQEDLKGAVLQIYNMLGGEVYYTDQVEVLNCLNINDLYGNYVIRITTAEGSVLDGKITMVR